MNQKILENIRKVVPYIPGEQPQFPVIKLNTNENPYPPAKEVKEILEALEINKFRLYPDPTSSCLVEAIADYYKIDSNKVFVGVGSDDVLAMCFMTFFNSEKPIYFPDITYSFYEVWAELFKIPYESRALDENFRIKKSDYYGENGGVIFPNPNAPTAIYEELDFVEDMIRANRDVIVIVDEAYVDFAGKSAMELVDKYENLVVVQTYSKARSMAGMRIGYAIANPTLIQYLNDVKYSFNSYTMNLPSLECGVATLQDREYFEETVEKIIDTREWAKSELKGLGFEFTDSKANFIFATHPNYDAKEIFEHLKESHIYVRHWNKERIAQYLRITIGTRDEMQALFDALKKFIG